MTTVLPAILKSGEPARLIPTVAETSKEARAASIFIATLAAVPDYAAILLGELDVRIGARSRLNCFTEVTTLTPTDVGLRPDGLIVVRNGKQEWTADPAP